MRSQETVKDLCTAIESDDSDAVRDIVTKDPEILNVCISSDSEWTYTPLWLATKIGQEKIIELLIELGADPNQRASVEIEGSRYSMSLLHSMPFFDHEKKNKMEVASILIKHGADVNSSSIHMLKTPLQTAILMGDVNYSTFLLQKGGRLKGPEWENRNLMQYVYGAPIAKQKEILQLLVQHGFNTKTSYNTNYIHLTIRAELRKPGTVDVVGITKILLDSGVPVNDFDECRQSALLMAILMRNPDLVSLLLERGAHFDVKIRTPAGVETNFLCVAIQKNSKAIIDLLLKYGVDVNGKTEFGWTALHTACVNRRVEAVSHLIQKGALLNVEDQGGRTPFSYLNPEEFNAPDVPTITAMIKQMAIKCFYVDPVSPKDMDLIFSYHPLTQLFQQCTAELFQLFRFKFHKNYTYDRVWNMSNGNIKKLANLTKNEEFVSSFTKNLASLHFYKDEFERILKEAIRIRNELLVVDQKLKTAFGDSFPSKVIEKLANNLTL